MPINPAHLAHRRTDAVNEALTMNFVSPSRLAGGDRQGHVKHMKTRSTAAGGIFLFLGPVIGAVYGISRGQPIQWMLIGFGTGVALALAFWLFDRTRR